MEEKRGARFELDWRRRHLNLWPSWIIGLRRTRAKLAGNGWIAIFHYRGSAGRFLIPHWSEGLPERRPRGPELSRLRRHGSKIEKGCLCAEVI